MMMTKLGSSFWKSYSRHGFNTSGSLVLGGRTKSGKLLKREA